MSSDRQIELGDGRALGLAEFGAPDGSPVIYCHGFPASRLEARLAHRAAIRVGVRLIAIDRPGYGLSDLARSRFIHDWPRDVSSAADALQLRRFAVLGVSGGAPYAFACAALIPERITSIAIVCGLGSTDGIDGAAQLNIFARSSLWLARTAPVLSLTFNRVLGPILRERPEWVLRLLAAKMPPADRATLADPDVYAMLAASMREAFRQGGEGAARDLVRLARPWHFDITSLRMPCYLWHGEQDTTVPVTMGKRIALLVPGCRAEFLPDEGHFSLPVRHMSAILASLLQRR